MSILKKYYAIFTGLFSFIIYLLTIAPSVVEIDSGELAAVQSTLGIAHPTGYPLFSMLGYLFLSLPLPFSKIFMANLLSALWCSLGVIVFTMTAKMVLDNLSAFSLSRNIKAAAKKHLKKEHKKDRHESPAIKEKQKETDIPETKKIITSVSGGLVLAFSRTYWNQSTSVEVYSLHVFLILTVIFFLLKAYLKAGSPANDRYANDRYANDISGWIIFSLALALCFSNHMTTLLILPGAAYLYFERNRFITASYKKIFIMLFCFFPLLIALYSYLPVRAAQDPIMNWGNPVDSERLFRHISGRQYQVWMFSSIEAAKKQLGYFITNLPSEFAIVSLVLVLIGLFQLFISAKKFFIFIVITFISTVVYSINYEIVDIDSYFLLAYIALSFISVFGILKVLSLLKPEGDPYHIPMAAVFVLICLQIYINFNDVNRSGLKIYEDYTKSLLSSTEKNSIVLSYQWDYFVSQSYYFQKVENYRPDITVIDKELLRRSWYFNQIRRNSPEVYSKLQPYSSQFLKALQPFERDENFSAELLERLYRNLMTHLVTDNIDKHAIYIAPELVENEMAKGEFALPEGYTLVPDLFLFKVVRTNDYVPAASPDFKIRIPKTKSPYVENIERFIGSMLVRRALYEMKFDKADKARMYINKVKSDLPDYQVPYDLAQVFN